MTQTRHPLTILAFAAALVAAAPALAEMPDAVHAAVLAAPAATPLQVHVAEVPAAVRAVAFPYMVDPGQPFQVTDTISPGSTLPGGRLVWGARLGRFYVLHSEFGGIAHAFHVRVYDLTPAGAKLLWTSTANARYPTLAAFQAALRAGKVAYQ